MPHEAGYDQVVLSDDEDKQRRELAISALEAARAEACRRLRAKSLPTSIEVPQMVVEDEPDGTGWRSTWEAVPRSSLNSLEVVAAIRDESVATKFLGLRDQLLALAQHLASTTHLGEVAEMGLLPGVGGTDGALARYVQPLAYDYLLALDDVAKPGVEVRDRLLDELDDVCGRPMTRRYRRQYPLTGLTTAEALGPYRGVALRPLTGVERGRVAAERTRRLDYESPRDGGFVPRRPHSVADPRALLEIVTERDRKALSDASELPARVHLAFYLSGFTLGSSGGPVGFEEPPWSGFGTSTFEPSLPDRWPAEDRPIARDVFEDVVRLAHRIPDFGRGESNARDIALYRALRGFNSTESGLLDFAIALEAAVLGALEARTELAYRFSLYGSLFLRQVRDPATTFERFKRVYDTRSRLVHGSRINPADRSAAEVDAADLTRAVILRAVEIGWPDPKALNLAALASHTN